MSAPETLAWSQPDPEQTEALGRIAEMLDDPEALIAERYLYLRHELLTDEPFLSEFGLSQLGRLFSSDASMVRLQKEIAQEVRGNGMFLLRGLPASSPAILLGLILSLGKAVTVGNGPLARAAFRPDDADRHDLFDTEQAMPLMSAGTFAKDAPEYVAFMCGQGGSSAGGKLLVLPLSEIVSRLESRTIEVLSEPIFPHVDRDAPISGLGQKVTMPNGLPSISTNGFMRKPILIRRDDSDPPSIRYRAETIRAALDMDGCPPLADRATEALNQLEGIIEAGQQIRHHVPEPGDVLFLDNRIMLHGRTAISPDASYLVWRSVATTNPDVIALERRVGRQPVYLGSYEKFKTVAHGKASG